MNSIDEIFDQVTKLNLEKKQLFYFKLGLNLTISVRSFADDHRYDDHVKLEGLKNINELSHRNFNWLWKLTYSTDTTFDDSHMLNTVKDYCKLYPKSAGEIVEAVRSSYHQVSRPNT